MLFVPAAGNAIVTTPVSVSAVESGVNVTPLSACPLSVTVIVPPGNVVTAGSPTTAVIVSDCP